MGTLRWTSTYERGFECLQPVRLTVSPSHRRRSLLFGSLCCLSCLFFFGFVALLLFLVAFEIF